jgi:DNA invertase Pin-like site-specific DNA recombinase
MHRPALQRLLADIRTRLIDVVVVYKVDRLTRSLSDFAKLVELFDQNGVSFVSVTQAFNTTTSMGRLTLNVLLAHRQGSKLTRRRAYNQQHGPGRRPHDNARISGRPATATQTRPRR